MAFNIALSGLNAAQTDLDVKGNNIANASTTGFKRSRAEFGDLYSSGLQNLGDTSAGDGVSVQNTRQLFQQGNLTATNNGLDMAIDGEGFFVLDGANGERQFSRAGQFGVDEQGFVTNNQGARVQGFQATEDGEVGDVRGDLEVNTENLAPKSTTNVAANLNLDSRENVLRVDQTLIEANGDQIDELESGSIGNVGFDQTDWTVTDPEGNNSTFSTVDNSSAANIAASFASESGVSATANSQATLSNLNNQDAGDTLKLTLSDGGGSFNYNIDGSSSLQDIADDINADGSIALNAQAGGGDLTLADNEGRNIEVELTGGGTTELDLESQGPDTGPKNLDTTGPVTVFGNLEFTVQDGFDLAANNAQILSGSETGTSDIQNAFDPNDSNTYNHSTSTTIYDSLGNPHEMTQYFVKQSQVGNPDNSWKSYVEVDGELVGNTQDNPDGTDGFDLVFQNNGSLDTAQSDDVLINDWVPKDSSGNPNGAAGPNNGVEEPPLPPESSSSNFVLDYTNSTQVGSEFAINDLQQNGFATGRLTGLDVSEEGVIQARFSNGESQALGQVALANFRNNEGLAPVGDTSWVETFESGDAVISRPNTGPLGAIQASSLEESNVDLSEQLVGLITAQRNFQANSKTIETSDQITQTIINLR
ncbi:flagellar hook-basal body complex protein [Salicola sp. Rm-C-2C1-2]|uniref:flagellar hook-basal body complex protein n=1 Tax=Salicola sp. Rm-C-2C1-2 TaxID=3141321 RepID=UPI0032E4B0E5